MACCTAMSSQSLSLWYVKHLYLKHRSNWSNLWAFFDVFPSFDHHPKPEFHLRMVLTQLLLKSFQRRSQQLFAFLDSENQFSSGRRGHSLRNWVLPILAGWWLTYPSKKLLIYGHYMVNIWLLYYYMVHDGWWLTYPSEKYKSQLGLLFPIYGKIKNVSNHQPVTNLKEPYKHFWRPTFWFQKRFANRPLDSLCLCPLSRLGPFSRQ